MMYDIGACDQNAQRLASLARTVSWSQPRPS